LGVLPADKHQPYVDFARAQPGVVDALPIAPSEVVSAPGGLRPWEAEPVFRRYSAAILIHTHGKAASQQASLAVERKAFLDGLYFAFRSGVKKPTHP